MNGKIELIIGPMFSGKTTEMFLRVQRYVHAGGHPLIIRFSGDNRYEGGRKGLATSHDNMSMTAVSLPSAGLGPYIPGLKDATVVGIDEGQFFDNLSEFCEYLAQQGKTVIVAALDSTSERTKFKETLNLIPKCEKLNKLQGVCISCQEPASFSRKIVPTHDPNSIIDIGGDDKYVCTCRACFEKPLDQAILDKRKQSVDIILEMRK